MRASDGMHSDVGLLMSEGSNLSCSMPTKSCIVERILSCLGPSNKDCPEKSLSLGLIAGMCSLDHDMICCRPLSILRHSVVSVCDKGLALDAQHIVSLFTSFGGSAAVRSFQHCSTMTTPDTLACLKDTDTFDFSLPQHLRTSSVILH